MFDPNNPVFWVMISFVAFMALLLYFRVPTLIGKALDKRAEAIRDELDEARRLRDEAQALLADYQRKSREAENEAQAIIEQAKREGAAMAAETRKSLEESLERRTRLAEDKIAQAETQAINDVRATAAEVAVGAARRVIADKVDASKDAQLIEKSISDLASKLH